MTRESTSADSSGPPSAKGPLPETKVWKVALAGFGTVGRSVARILVERTGTPVRLTHVCNRNVERKKVDWLPPDIIWTDNIDDVLSSDVDIVVEVIGGVLPTEDWIRRALASGKSVVTANKQLIAHCGPELIGMARRLHQYIEFGASVAGGVPVISGLHQGLAGDDLFKLCGILNGTCNYILTQIESSGVPFTTALREAQKLGFAEADPTEDIDGLDARAKLAILTRVGLHCDVAAQSIMAQSISPVDAVDFEYAKQLDCTIRQISRAELKGDMLYAAVQPRSCRSTRPSPASNAARISSSPPAPTAAKPSSEATAPAAIPRRSRSSPTFSPSFMPSRRTVASLKTRTRNPAPRRNLPPSPATLQPAIIFASW